mmetsp:Transcript_106434/g.299202  ORF Transcript_106434/g.299202 Transcript_106434/m.299202 type:complete len:97 (+) Transcript_106434:57-347(+)
MSPTTKLLPRSNGAALRAVIRPRADSVAALTEWELYVQYAQRNKAQLIFMRQLIPYRLRLCSQPNWRWLRKGSVPLVEHSCRDVMLFFVANEKRMT